MTRVEVAARALVGVRFRLHGRDATHGLDCVGLVALATGREAPTGYGWRSGDEGRVAAMLDAVFARGAPAPGAILLLRVGPGQLHLAIRVSDGAISTNWPSCVGHRLPECARTTRRCCASGQRC